MAKMSDEEKELELYKASLPAFFMNEVETDKIILTLSVGAIGFYSALLTSKHMLYTEVIFVSMIISVVLYGVTIAMVIGVFTQNKKHLLSIIENNGKGKENPHLTFLDNHKYKPFIGAVVFSIIFMLALLFENIHKEGVPMSDNKSVKKVEITKGQLSREGFSEIVKANSENKTKPDNNNTEKKGN
jgi:uncharacterized protein YacL